MTNKQINIAMAKACGWREEPEPIGSFNATAWWHNNYRYPSSVMPVPDYCNDLNAMHEAEKVLDYEQCEAFVDTITDTVHAANRERDYEFPWGFTRIHATAKQRAEAFLRTLGKWEEAK